MIVKYKEPMSDVSYKYYAITNGIKRFVYFSLIL